MSTQIQRQDNLLTYAYYVYKKDLSRYSFSKINNPTLSENLVQDTFLKAWKYLMRGGKIQTMKAFLYHVLNGLIIDEYRKRKTVSLDNLVEKGYEPKENDAEDIINLLDSKRAAKMISLLPKKYRQLMRMKYVKSMSLGEMSEVVGQSKNTIAVQINRGLTKLKKIYDVQNTFQSNVPTV